MLRQFYVRRLLGRVEVGEKQICLVGPTKALEHTVGRMDTSLDRLVPGIER